MGDRFETRNAYYIGGSNTNTIIFEYIPEPGDHSQKLDYYTKKEEVNNGRDSFQFGEINSNNINSIIGEIFVLSHKPSVSMSINLSPTYGQLKGKTSVHSVNGIYLFKDLNVDYYGLNYYLRFSSKNQMIDLNSIQSYNENNYQNTYQNNYFYNDNNIITTSNSVFVSFSSQFTVIPPDAYTGNSVCKSVSMSGGLAVCGAPNSNSSIYPVQSILTSISNKYTKPVHEIQVIRTYIQSQPAILSFYTTADINTDITGTFTIVFGEFGSSQPIPFNAKGEMLQAILTSTIPEIGNITVVREDYAYCACNNAYKWILVFNNFVEGYLPDFTIFSSLSGEGAQVIGPKILQVPSHLGGTFFIEIVSSNGSLVRTHDLLYNITGESCR